MTTTTGLSTFAAGTSPFRVKGLGWLAAREYYERVVPGGMAAVRRSIAASGDAALLRFVDTPFVAGGWYDALPAMSVSRAAARLADMPHAQLLRENAAWMADRDLRGVYRVLLGLASVEMVALRLPRLSMQYLDFGHAEAKVAGPRFVEACRFGVPAPLVSWFTFGSQGFIPVALKLAGARSVRVRHGKTRPDGFDHGTLLVQVPFEIEWD